MGLGVDPSTGTKLPVGVFETHTQELEMQIRDLKLGQWVRVIYDGAVATVDGARSRRPLVLEGLEVEDGIVVEKDHRDDPKPLSCKVFFPGTGRTDVLHADQIVTTGNTMVAGRRTGLPVLA